MNNDLLLVDMEHRYRSEKARQQLRAVRYRRWRKRLEWDGPGAATDAKNWIN